MQDRYSLTDITIRFIFHRIAKSLTEKNKKKNRKIAKRKKKKNTIVWKVTVQCVNQSFLSREKYNGHLPSWIDSRHGSIRWVQYNLKGTFFSRVNGYAKWIFSCVICMCVYVNVTKIVTLLSSRICCRRYSSIDKIKMMI